MTKENNDILPPDDLCDAAFYGTVGLLALGSMLVKKRRQPNRRDLRPINPPPTAATSPPHS